MGVWAAAIQGVLGVDSAIQGGLADKRQADRNTAISNAAAADALQRGGQEAGATRQAGSQVAAQQRVAYANSGVDANVGTAANVQAGTKALAELDAQVVENNAAREAWGYKQHGLDYQTQAGLSASRRAREAAGTILGAAGSFASQTAKKSGRGDK